MAELDRRTARNRWPVPHLGALFGVPSLTSSKAYGRVMPPVKPLGLIFNAYVLPYTHGADAPMRAANHRSARHHDSTAALPGNQRHVRAGGREGNCGRRGAATPRDHRRPSRRASNGPGDHRQRRGVPPSGHTVRRLDPRRTRSPRSIGVSPARRSIPPPGTGKTRKWLAQSAVLWPGPCLVSSSKDDLMQLVASRRIGPVALLDLRPIAAPLYPTDFTP
jgi:hypothetical protein